MIPAGVAAPTPAPNARPLGHLWRVAVRALRGPPFHDVQDAVTARPVFAKTAYILIQIWSAQENQPCYIGFRDHFLT